MSRLSSRTLRESWGGEKSAAVQDDVSIISITPDVCQGLPEHIDELIAKHRVRRVVFDLDKVDYLSSLHIAALITARQAIHAAGGRVSLANVPPALRNVLRVLKLDRIFALDLDRAAAIAALSG